MYVWALNIFVVAFDVSVPSWTIWIARTLCEVETSYTTFKTSIVPCFTCFDADLFACCKYRWNCFIFRALVYFGILWLFSIWEKWIPYRWLESVVFCISPFALDFDRISCCYVFCFGVHWLTSVLWMVAPSVILNLRSNSFHKWDFNEISLYSTNTSL